MTTMTGTEKQITWANEIRVAHLASCDAAVTFMSTKIDERLAAGDPVPASYVEMRDRIVALITWFAGHNEAGWWITNRDSLLTRPDQAASNCQNLRGIVSSNRFRMSKIQF